MGFVSKVSFIKRPKVFIPLIVLLILISAVILAMHNLNAPAVGQVSQTPPAQTEIIDPYSHSNKYDGQYISFTYPAHYKPVPATKTGSILEVAYFYATNQTSKQISVNVIKENISADSGISLRLSQPDKYVELPRNKSGIIEFTSTSSGSEQTAYVPHGSLVASFSITAPPNWDLNQDMQTMLDSLKWK